MELLERDGVLRHLVGLVAEAGEGRGRIALIRGEAGIGKTSVARALTGLVSDRAHVLWGSCDDLLTPRPLGPVSDMAFDEPVLADALSSGDPNGILSTLMSLLTRALRPTLAVFEDVHWADGATLDLLTSLGRRIDRTHAVLVLTFRERIPTDHPLAAVLGDLPHDRVDQVELAPLSRDAVNTLAGDAERAARVWDLSHGNPFFATELLRHTGGNVSTSVVDAIRSQVGRLTAKGEQLVTLVSVVPGGIDLVLLDEVDPGLRDVVGEAEDLRLLELLDNSVGFRHELARTAVEATLAEPSKRRLHRRVLAAGEHLGLDPVRLAHHARQGRDVEAMVRLLPQAARLAAERHSHREAITLFVALEPHLDRLPFEHQAELLELWAAEEEFVTGGGLHHALAAVELRRRLNDPAGAGSGLIAAARSAWAGLDFATARRLIDEAITELSDIGGEPLALAYGQMARVEAMDFQFASALSFSEKALDLAPEHSQARIVALGIGGAVRNLWSYPDGSDLLREAMDLAQRLGLAWELQRARANLIETALWNMDIVEARQLNDAVLGLLDETAGAHGWHRMIQAAIATAAGDYVSAQPVLEDIVDGRGLLQPTLRFHAEFPLTRVLIRRGDPDAGAAVGRISDRADAIGQTMDRFAAARLSAEYLWAFRREDEAATDRNLETYRASLPRSPSWSIGEFALWLWLDGHLDRLPDHAPQPLLWLTNGQWQRSAAWFADRGAPFEEAVALSRGDTAARLDAYRIARDIGAQALAAQIRHDLRSDGVTGIPRGPRKATKQHALGLTSRQTDVLALVADGLTNAEIADRLFISVRTVENHVSAILAKLAVTNRDEARHVANRHR